VDLTDHADAIRLRRNANRRLARAFLNRAHDALRAGRPELAREALRRGLSLAPSEVSAFLRDPRFGVRMAALIVAPRLAGRLFRRPE
jgi:hypothetical protein